MDLESSQRQLTFQDEVAEHYEHIAASKNVSPEMKLGLLEFLQHGAASSEEAVSVRRRLITAHKSVDTLPYDARTRRDIRNAGSLILIHSFSGRRHS